ncbi:hypothetical protein GCM10009616_35570 [Microlunatus lacustris]
MTTPLTPPNVLVLLPARARQALYIAYGLAGLTAGSALVGYASAEFAIPLWLTVTSAVITYLSVPFAAIAATNIIRTPAEAAPDVHGGKPWDGDA